MTALIGIVLSYVAVLVIGKYVKNLVIKDYAIVFIIAIITTLIVVLYLFNMKTPEL